MPGNNSKAVRDLIPEIIKLSGRKCMVSELSDFSFLSELENKLFEELKEYIESKELEELADLLEIIYRIAELRGSSKEGLEALRLRKKQEKGGFENNRVLLNPSEKEDFLSEMHSASPAESKSVVFRHENAAVIEKHGVKMRIYTTKAESRNAAVLYKETQAGHA
jgi:predicted house-cleaning noncanonical NTP pyrophosphatase (MazG superfamily)